MNIFKLFVISFLALGAFALSSCGCRTGEEPPPKLKPLPTFAPLPDGGNAPAAAAAAAAAAAGVDSPAPEIIEDFK
jgi:hypothetical protein